SNGSMDKFVVYTISPTSIKLAKTYSVSQALWGIHLDGNTLYAVEDVSDRVLRFDNFFDLPAGVITPNKTVKIESMVRTHGITYERDGDIMILTDVASAASATDGALTVIHNYSTKASDGLITEAEQIIVEGPLSLLGNPVDISYDKPTNRIYVAERAKDGGRVLGFTMPTESKDAAPVFNTVFAGASAIYLGNQRPKVVVIPTIAVINPNFTDDILVSARLSGSNEVPSTTSEAVGVATVTFNSTYTQATLNVSVFNLSSAFAGAHIHIGKSGTNGAVKFNFTTDYKKGRIRSAFNVTKADVAALIDGDYYLNIHSANFPNGEIRGQLAVEAAESFKAELSGAKEIPMAITIAKGLSSVIYTANTNVMELNILASGLSGPIKGIHLHRGASNVSGSVVENLTTFVKGNTVIVKLKAGAYIEDLRAGNIYVNIHTDAFPGGEIRGQLAAVKGLHFDSFMTGDQEVPKVINSTLGMVMGEINSTLDKMSYRMLIDNPVSVITAAHIHKGKLNAAGGVIVDLGSHLKGNFASSDSIAVTSSLLSDFLSGNLYFNVHSPTYPAGEVRGQVYRIARDGYAYDLCPQQEATPVLSPGNASGSGMFAFNRHLDEAHMMVVASELSSPFQS
ncbi:MAG: CHRD domain-containing protein, partial [Saprospiraceae bacterium]